METNHRSDLYGGEREGERCVLKATYSFSCEKLGQAPEACSLCDMIIWPLSHLVQSICCVS